MQLREAVEGLLGYPPPQIGTRLEAFRAPSRVGRQHAVEGGALGTRAAGVGDLDTDVRRREPPRRLRDPPRASAVALDGQDLPPSLHQSREVGAFAAGARAQVEHALAGPRGQRPRATSMAARDWP